MTHLLPRLFFEHFQNTSFVTVEDADIIAFRIGFMSQTDPHVAYIHFVGVHPDHRKSGLARQLYDIFFDKVRSLGCRTIHCVTSPINTGSVAFHTGMGFSVQLSKDYAGPGEDRVLFAKEISR